eukprot:1424310-Prymnesium_polylepis.1
MAPPMARAQTNAYSTVPNMGWLLAPGSPEMREGAPMAPWSQASAKAQPPPPPAGAERPFTTPDRYVRPLRLPQLPDR